MSKKSKRVWLIVLLCLVISLGIAYSVLYCIYPQQTQKITWDIVDYICNKPLPVIGVTSLVLIFAIFKIIKFVISNKTIKIVELKAKIDELKVELDKSKEESENLKQELFSYIGGYQEQLKEVCKAIPNKKVKELGEKINVQAIDNKTETKEI